MKKQKMFDPKEAARFTQTKQSIVDADGETVHYYPLTFGDTMELKDSVSSPEYGSKLLHRMLSRAYEGLTLEDVQKWPLKKVQILLEKLLLEQGFGGKDLPKGPKGEDQNVKQ